jgi:hypothetical protein
MQIAISMFVWSNSARASEIFLVPAPDTALESGSVADATALVRSRLPMRLIK